MNFAVLKAILEDEEGRIVHGYHDHKGFLTIGVGHLIDERRGGGLSDKVINIILDDDVSDCITDLVRTIPNWAVLPDNVQEALTLMRFQLGLEGLRGFTLMLAAIAREDWHAAADEGLDSKWAREDTPGRAYRVAALMRGAG